MASCPGSLSNGIDCVMVSMNCFIVGSVFTRRATAASLRPPAVCAANFNILRSNTAFQISSAAFNLLASKATVLLVAPENVASRRLSSSLCLASKTALNRASLLVTSPRSFSISLSKPNSARRFSHAGKKLRPKYRPPPISSIGQRNKIEPRLPLILAPKSQPNLRPRSPSANPLGRLSKARGNCRAWECGRRERPLSGLASESKARRIEPCPKACPIGVFSFFGGKRTGTNPLKRIGSPGKIRTCGQPVNSRLLYH